MGFKDEKYFSKVFKKMKGQSPSEYRKVWADYICRYIKEYRKHGYLVRRISLQNEPKAVQTWDSCVYTARQEKEFLRDYMWPALQENGLSDIEVFIWDHNKERVYERACEIIDETTDHMFSHFIKPGAVRIGSTVYSDDLEATALLNPNNQIVVVLLNRNAYEVTVNVRMADTMAELSVRPNAIGTVVIA